MRPARFGEARFARAVGAAARSTLAPMRACVPVICLLLTAAVPSGALTVLPATFDELVRESHAVVYGRVASVEGRWSADRRTIESIVTLEALEHFKGTVTETTTFRVPGGEAGGRRVVIPGVPSFRAGDAVVVFLAGRAPALPAPVGLSLGVYRVAADPRSGGLVVVPTPVHAAAAPTRIVRGGPGRAVQSLAGFGAEVRAVKEQR